MPVKPCIAAGCLAVTLTACATYTATLTDAKGQTITCEASGRVGLLTYHYLREGFDDCVEAAEARGFSEIAPRTGANR